MVTRPCSPFVTKDPGIVDENRDGAKRVQCSLDYSRAVCNGRGVDHSLAASWEWT